MMGADMNEATPSSPFKWDVRAVEIGKEGGEGRWETLGGDTCEVHTLCIP
jgi:hypothetical protein